MQLHGHLNGAACAPRRGAQGMGEMGGCVRCMATPRLQMPHSAAPLLLTTVTVAGAAFSATVHVVWAKPAALVDATPAPSAAPPVYGGHSGCTLSVASGSAVSS